MIEILDDLHFRINGYLVDIVHIDHWGRHQGSGKFHGVRTAIGVLQKFAQSALETPSLTEDARQIRRVRNTLRRLAEYGYHIPDGVFQDA